MHLVRVVIDGGLEPLHLAVHEATVGVDDRIAAVEVNGLIKVMNGILESAQEKYKLVNRLYLLSSIAMAARTVVPVDGVLLVVLHSCGEVGDGFVVFEESVPNESTSIVGRGVLRIELNDLVEVLEG